MRFWLSRSSEVSIQEQLTTQLMLGIVSSDLAPGERLPSTNQLARKFGVHPNTVRAAYRRLADRGWIEWRKGSGFYVRGWPNAQTGPAGPAGPGLELDHLISTFLKVARQRGYTLSEIQSRISRWFSLQVPDHVLVIEPVPELREILVAEIEEKTSARVEGIASGESPVPTQHIGAIYAALHNHGEQLRSTLPPEAPFVFLHSRSIPKTLARERRPALDELITVVSRWPDFLQWARTTLVAVGIDAASLDLRDARRKGWNRGLTARSFIITDSLLARLLPQNCRPRIFQLISDESIQELRTELQKGKI